MFALKNRKYLKSLNYKKALKEYFNSVSEAEIKSQNSRKYNYTYSFCDNYIVNTAFTISEVFCWRSKIKMILLSELSVLNYFRIISLFCEWWSQ